MFRYEDGKDITDEEFKNVCIPHLRKWERFNEEYIIPDSVAFYIAYGYLDSALWEESLQVHINSAVDLFNVKIKNKKRLKDNIIKILKIKYDLEIISEDPLDFKKKTD